MKEKAFENRIVRLLTERVGLIRMAQDGLKLRLQTCLLADLEDRKLHELSRRVSIDQYADPLDPLPADEIETDKIEIQVSMKLYYNQDVERWLYTPSWTIGWYDQYGVFGEEHTQIEWTVWNVFDYGTICKRDGIEKDFKYSPQEIQIITGILQNYRAN